ncbi:MAG TPA: DUF2058 family protein [Steroidobacteraceae bacterium]
MSTSLRDQLIQAGLVTEKQARLASRPVRPAPQARRGPAPVPEQRLAAQRAQADKAARDQELNLRLKAKSERAARWAQVRQLIEQHQLPRIESEDFFHFCDGKKIKRIAVNGAVREQLGRGELCIVRVDHRYALVPAAAAARIREREAAAIIEPGAAVAAVAPEEAYSEFPIPDDLTW